MMECIRSNFRLKVSRQNSVTLRGISFESALLTCQGIVKKHCRRESRQYGIIMLHLIVRPRRSR